jgi:hypothetical protein
LGCRARGDAGVGVKALKPVPEVARFDCGSTLGLAANGLLEPGVVLGHCGGAVERTVFWLLFCREDEPPGVVVAEPERLEPPVAVRPLAEAAGPVGEADCKPEAV